MHLTPSDPDIATLVRKIETKRLDLQPNFQRGEVWGKQKKQRLIDSLLRRWHIPPIHVIQSVDSVVQEVLDGQQRLAAIRDFINGEFPINGHQEPLDHQILKLDGYYWHDLPENVKGAIEDFTIRVLTISDFNPGEPGELFYRLNQPTNLTSAEQRNAFFGEARKQVKEISEFMLDMGFSRETLGFSNSRMAYDDVIAKFLLTLEQGTLKKKITANSVTARFRDSEGFSEYYLNRTVHAIEVLMNCIKDNNEDYKLNKASTLSWLIFIDRHISWFDNQDILMEFFEYFESAKKDSKMFYSSELPMPEMMAENLLKKIFNIYIDRSSSRVADTSSVILRDLTSWIVYILWPGSRNTINENVKELREMIFITLSRESTNFNEVQVDIIGTQLGWGNEI